jgi:hypothetical protein
MNDSFKSGFASGHRLRNTAALLWALLFFSIQPASGQDASELFRGTWQIDTPDKGAIVVLLKDQGRAAYFWGDNADRTVYPGQWAADENGAKIHWQDNDSLRLKRGSTGFTATAFAADGQKRYSAAARQIPQEILGQWAKPPTREDEMRSEREQAQGFFGIWKIGSEDPEFIFVEPDRATASTAGREARGRRGQWAKQGSELHIIWDSGEYGILRETERGFNYQLVASGEIIEEDSSEPRSAMRTLESKVPAEWLNHYQAEREQSTGGIAFPGQKEARNFYRGEWLVRRGEETFERLTLSRFGGLETSRNRSLGGQWRLSGQDLFMRWDDGIRKIISPVGQGFVVYEYRPGRPLDGVPARVLPAAPADGGKFEKHLKDRAEVAERMREMASAAGVTPDQREDSGWGRSFARWVWPFKEDETGTSTDEMLTEEFEPDEGADPWWWPFWSEKEQDSQSSESGEEAREAKEVNDTGAETTEAAVPDPAPRPADSATGREVDVAPTERTDAPKRQGSARDWLWPF